MIVAFLQGIFSKNDQSMTGGYLLISLLFMSIGEVFDDGLLFSPEQATCSLPTTLQVQIPSQLVKVLKR
jgi:hypothetical protein